MSDNTPPENEMIEPEGEPAPLESSAPESDAPESSSPASKLEKTPKTKSSKKPSKKAVDGDDAPPQEQEAEAPKEPEIPQPRPEELLAVLEALLFATTTPLNLKRLVLLTGGVDAEEIEGALNSLRERYDHSESGLMLMEVAGGYQIATRPMVSDWVLALHKHRKKNPISPAVMETLAIVAYKQPIVKAEIETIRGVDCGGAMRTLQDAGLVEVVGQKEVIGRPSLYGTSETFLKTFGLTSLDELPSVLDLKKILTTPMKGSEEQTEAEEAEVEQAEAQAEPQAPETKASPAEEPDADPAEEPTPEEPTPAEAAEPESEGEETPLQDDPSDDPTGP